jgi:hypothetical protein
MRTAAQLGQALLIAAFFSSSALSQATNGNGEIRGTALTHDGSPVADAHVYVHVMQGQKILTVLNANTDDDGKFVFSGLGTGEYHLSADKRETGCLSTRPDIFGSRPPLTILHTQDAPTANTISRFAPKAGVISGWVRDSVTGKSIPAHLSLAPISGGRGWSTTGTDGRFKCRLQIPADTAVRLVPQLAYNTDIND